MELTTLPTTVINVLLPYLAEGGQAFVADTSLGEIADLEIGLHKRSGNLYSVETRFQAPGSSSETRLGSNELVEVDINEETLKAQHGWKDYGRVLSEALFKSDSLRLIFGQALSRAGNTPLRLRVLIGPTALELHRLWWETMTNPLDGTLLAANQNILLSRYLAGAGGQEVRARSRKDIRALVAVANPLDLNEYDLDPINVPDELKRAVSSLKGIPTAVLSSANGGCTLAELVRKLQDGYDILYLVAHGALVRGQSWVWLENEQGLTQRVSGADLAGQIRLLERPPLLIVLASCESAGEGQGDSLQALGPQLGEAGVAAVIAMQGKIAMQTLARSMPVFFEKLQQNGCVDRALASARATLAAAGDSDLWMPALFMRLKDGLLWKQNGSNAPAEVIQLWHIIQENFENKPAAMSALEDLLGNSDDTDNQEAFRIQLKKAVQADPAFAARLSQALPANQTPGSGGVSVSVGGNVGGNIVIGSNNTILPH